MTETIIENPIVDVAVTTATSTASLEASKLISKLVELVTPFIPEPPPPPVIIPPTTGLTFSEALVLLKEGKRVSREDWRVVNLSLEYSAPNKINGMSIPAFIALSRNQTSASMWMMQQVDILAEDYYLM